MSRPFPCATCWSASAPCSATSPSPSACSPSPSGSSRRGGCSAKSRCRCCAVSERPAFEPLGLDHVVLRVADQAASRKFYEEVLGCTLEFVNEPIRLVQLRFGEALIDLLPADGPPPLHGRGVDHICLSIRAKDLEAVAIALRARGVETDGEVKQRRGAWGVGPSLYIRDLDGYQIELKPRD